MSHVRHFSTKRVGALTVAGGQPIELQVYEAWWFALTHKHVSKAPLRAQPIIRFCIRKFPGIRRATLPHQKQLAQRVLDAVRDDPSLIMPIDRQVDDGLARRREAGRRTHRKRSRSSI